MSPVFYCEGKSSLRGCWIASTKGVRREEKRREDIKISLNFSNYHNSCGVLLQDKAVWEVTAMAFQHRDPLKDIFSLHCLTYILLLF